MTRLEAITEAYLIATGKTSLPASGTSKRDRLEGLCTKVYRDVQKAEEWNWLYDVVSAGTVTASDTFSLSDEVNKISTDQQRENNYVRIKYGDNQYRYFKTVLRSQLHRYRNADAVALASDNSIQFSRAFTSADTGFGGTIEVPAILKLDELAADTDDVHPELEAYLPARLAALYVRTDSQLNYLFPDLTDDADKLYRELQDRNTDGNASTSTGIDYFASMGNVGSGSGGYLE